MKFRGWPALATVLLAASCAQPETPPPAPPLAQVGFHDLPGWADDPASETIPAFARQCQHLASLPPGTDLGGRDLPRATAGIAAQWRAACAALPPAATDAQARRFIEAWFQPYRVDAPAMFAGYFEPVVQGAWQPSGAYRIPVRARPNDLFATRDAHGRTSLGRRDGDRFVPYWTRAQIEAGLSAALPLLYVSRLSDLVLLQLEGGGRVALPDGTAIRLVFAGSNGRPGTPLGRILADRRALAPDALTIANIRAWLDAHPGEAQAVVAADDRYEFFRVAADAPGAGPPGALGVPLTPGRSAAVNRHDVPLGLPLFLVTRDPVTGGAWRHLVLAQDTGADIQGAARADIFLGSGPEAARMAGEMHEPGTAYLLLPRPADARVAQTFEQNFSLPR